ERALPRHRHLIPVPLASMSLAIAGCPGLERTRAGRAARLGRAGQHALTGPVSGDRVGLGRAGEQMLAGFGAVPGAAVTVAYQVAGDVVGEDLDGVRICPLSPAARPAGGAGPGRGPGPAPAPGGCGGARRGGVWKRLEPPRGGGGTPPPPRDLRPPPRGWWCWAGPPPAAPGRSGPRRSCR